MSLYKTTFTFVVLSDKPIEHLDAGQIDYETIDGDCVMMSRNAEQEKLNPKEMVECLRKAGSEPGFFSLDDEGNPL